jgi:hypothetical protein
VAEIPTLVIISDPNMGDSICAMHAVQIMARERKLLFIDAMNAEVELIMRPRHALPMSAIPESGLFHVKHLSIQHCFRQWGGRLEMSPVRHYLRAAGITIPGELPKPNVDLLLKFNYATGAFEAPEVPQAGLVIAPFTQDPGRRWSYARWARVIGQLRDAKIPITIIGSASDREPWYGVDYYYGRSLSDVAYMMKHATIGTLTVDSGPSRLAQAVGAPNHIVLSPSIYPEAWVAEPESFQIRSLGPEPEWSVSEVVDAVLCRV